MKKLSLDLDALRVETFDTSARAASPRGTVYGNDSAATTTTYPETTFCAEDYSGDPCVNTLETACGIDCI
jgi:hypothetical protein